MELSEKQEEVLLKVPDEADRSTEEIVSAPAGDQFPDLGDRYDVIEQIGSGGMSDVYKVKDKHTSKLFVAKILKGSLLADAQVKERFQKEADLVQQLDHPNIVKVLDHALTENGTPYLIMEWAEGLTLAEHIKQAGTIPVKEATAIFHQILQALSHAHSKGIIHRDIKPSNVLLLNQEQGVQVKLMDFGIAKLLDAEGGSSGHTQSGTVLGSPAYMSPEQCLAEQIDARSDIYSMGCLMYETLTGNNPFVSTTPVSTILKHLEWEPESLSGEQYVELTIPDHLDEIVRKCLAKKPELRYETADSLRQALFPQPDLFSRVGAMAVDAGIALCLAWIISPILPPDIQEQMIISSYWKIPWLCLIYCLYSGIFDSSPLRATPGKLFMKLRVAGTTGSASPLVANIAAPLIVCAAATLLSQDSQECARAIDRAIGSNYEILDTIKSWTWFFSFIYVIYSILFVYIRKEQSLIDKLCGRRIVKKEAFWAGSQKPPGASKITYTLAALALATIVGLPMLNQYMFDFAWGNDNVTKHCAVYSRQSTAVGKSPTQLVMRPELRLYPDDCDFEPTTLAGKIAIRPIRAGIRLRADYFEGYINNIYEGTHTPGYWVFWGKVYLADGDLYEAEQLFLKAVKANPFEREAWRELAGLYDEMGQVKRAEEARKKAKEPPQYDSAMLAKLLNDNHRFAEALAMTKAATAKNAKDTMSFIEMGRALEGLGAHRTADKVFNRVSSIAPNNPSVLTYKADRALAGRDYAQAKLLAQQAIKTDQQHERAWQILSIASKELGDVAEAERAHRRSLELKPICKKKF